MIYNLKIRILINALFKGLKGRGGMVGEYASIYYNIFIHKLNSS